MSEDGTSTQLEDSKTGPRTIWLGPDAAWIVAALPRCEGVERVFPEDLTSSRFYTFWVGVREEVGLHGLRIHDCRHTWASQGVINGVGLTTVGRMSDTSAAPTPPSTPISTMPPCRAPPHRRRPSSQGRWDTGPSRRRCRTKRKTRMAAQGIGLAGRRTGRAVVQREGEERCHPGLLGSLDQDLTVPVVRPARPDRSPFDEHPSRRCHRRRRRGTSRRPRRRRVRRPLARRRDGSAGRPAVSFTPLQ